MSANQKWDMAQGYYVQHKYGKKKPGRLAKCVRCGVRRRKTSSGWEYDQVVDVYREGSPVKVVRWTMNNPRCIQKDFLDEIVADRKRRADRRRR